MKRSAQTVFLGAMCWGIPAHATAQADMPDSSLVSLDESLEPLIDRFNAEADKPRILMLLSPT